MLNAFRHQRYLHGGKARADLQNRSAQRLSASEVSPQVGRQYQARCPCVLNAFRHQRYLHRRRRRPRPGPSCVLNAFRHQRYLHTPDQLGRRRVYRAQRLSASEVSPHRPALRGSCLVGVLNAFRHQRYLHTPPPAIAAVAPGVLNAFRHQRYLHRHYRWEVSEYSYVLNAFRHQRYLHNYWYSPSLV